MNTPIHDELVLDSGHRVTSLVYDPATATWLMRAAGGDESTARSLVLAVTPEPGGEQSPLREVERFGGRRIQVGTWDPSLMAAGERIGVIGETAGILELVPEIVGTGAAVKVFSRRPAWVLPRSRAAQSSRRRGHLDRGRGDDELDARHHLRRSVRDSWMRRQLTPDGLAGRAPVLRSDAFYAALQRRNCELVTWPIAGLSEVGIRTADGLEHHLDTIVFADGPDVLGALGRRNHPHVVVAAPVVVGPASRVI